MKKSFPILTFILCIIFISCESDPEVSLEQENSNQPVFNLENTIGSEKGGPICIGEKNLFEREMHWFSFISAQVIYTNAEARQEISSYFLTSSTNEIEAADLIGSDALLIFQEFSQAFQDNLLVYLQPGYPAQGDGNPNFPPTTGGWPIGTPPETIANVFYSSLLGNNCVELYLPNSINFSNGFTVTSSSHPLNILQCNEGYLWSPDLTGGYHSTGILLNNSYRNTHDNILIARPYRTLTQECLYLEYNINDFEDFMD